MKPEHKWFAKALLKLFEDAESMQDLPQPDAAFWAGASKDLLIRLGMRWDSGLEEYTFPEEGD